MPGSTGSDYPGSMVKSWITMGVVEMVVGVDNHTDGSASESFRGFFNSITLRAECHAVDNYRAFTGF